MKHDERYLINVEFDGTSKAYLKTIYFKQRTYLTVTYLIIFSIQIETE